VVKIREGKMARNEVVHGPWKILLGAIKMQRGPPKTER
jgi:hypothetical protein